VNISPFPFPENETERLRALRSYDILDSFPEEEYDAITRLASYICQEPSAFITFIDDNRQWFKSKIGVSVEEVSRAQSMCKYTIMGNELVVVPDATQNARYADNDFVAGQAGIRFYARMAIV
jgi:GAF domain-containing protein